MAFRLSRCVAVHSPDVNKARDFYMENMQLRLVGKDGGLELGARSLRLFIDPGPPSPAVLEMVTDDGPQARDKIRRLGFEEKSWKGPGKPCLVVDPWGIVWNVFFDQTQPSTDPTGNFGPCLVSDKVGVLCNEPSEAADFYGVVFDELPSRTVDGSWTVDSGPNRLRVELGQESSALYLATDQCFDALAERGCTVVSMQPPRMQDPFGVIWGADVPPPSTHAVVMAGDGE